jgi:hypothetical protein
MIVWDENGSPYLRKVVCVLPPMVQAMYPVCSYGVGTDDGPVCWTYAGEIPKGLDVSGLPGHDIMMDDLKRGNQDA